MKKIILLLLLLIACPPSNEVLDKSEISPIPSSELKIAEKICTEHVKQYIKAFPGYEYENIAMNMIPGGQGGYPENAMLVITSNNLTVELYSPMPGRGQDFYEFGVNYVNGTCEVVHLRTHRALIPKIVYDKSVEQIKSDKRVNNFFSKAENPRLAVLDWMDDADERISNGRIKIPVLEKFEFKKPIEYVLWFIYAADGNCNLMVLLDSYGAVHTEMSYVFPQRGVSTAKFQEPEKNEEYCRSLIA